MMNRVSDYSEFCDLYFEECKNSEWFQDVLTDCYSLDTDKRAVNALIGCIHEGLRENFEEAVKFFWTVFLINPLIAIKAYQETDLLFGKVDLYATFKHIGPVDIYSGELREDVIYNTSTEFFLIFALEALLQKDLNPEELHAVIHNTYLDVLYQHDKEIMTNKKRYESNGKQAPQKWLNHRNLKHILEATDPRHMIVLLSFFAGKYGARLHKGNVGRHCYSKDKYEYIIRFIKDRYGSLSEYILWDNHNYLYFYKNYYRTAMKYPEMKKDIDVVFPTEDDKKRISSD